MKARESDFHETKPTDDIHDKCVNVQIMNQDGTFFRKGINSMQSNNTNQSLARLF